MDGHCAPEAERLATWGCSLLTGKRLHRSAVCTPGHTSATGATVHRRSPGGGRSQWTASRKARAIAAGSVARRTAVCAATPRQCESADRRWGVMPPRAKHGTGAAERQAAKPIHPEHRPSVPGLRPRGMHGREENRVGPFCLRELLWRVHRGADPPVRRKVAGGPPGDGARRPAGAGARRPAGPRRGGRSPPAGPPCGGRRRRASGRARGRRAPAPPGRGAGCRPPARARPPPRARPGGSSSGSVQSVMTISRGSAQSTRPSRGLEAEP